MPSDEQLGERTDDTPRQQAKKVTRELFQGHRGVVKIQQHTELDDQMTERVAGRVREAIESEIYTSIKEARRDE